MYTGGTTGLPKGVLLDQRAEMLNLYHVAHGVARSTSDDVYLHQTPMFHAASMGGILGVPGRRRRVGVRAAVRPGAGARRDRAAPGDHDGDGADDDRHAARPPRASSPSGSRRCETLTYGASPMPAALLDALLDAVPRPRHLPGLRHDRGVGGAHRARARGAPRAAATLLRSAGRPLPGVDAHRSRTPTATSLPTGETGEVCARGRQLHARVLEASPRRPPRRSAAAGTTPATPATSTSEGYLFLVDRVKDMIVTGGENVYSIEVENAIATHPGGRPGRGDRHPDDAVGRGRARDRRAAARAPTRDRGRDHRARAASRSPATRCPKSVEFRAEPLPLSGAMKVLKRELRAPYWEGQDRAVG